MQALSKQVAFLDIDCVIPSLLSLSFQRVRSVEVASQNVIGYTSLLAFIGIVFFSPVFEEQAFLPHQLENCLSGDSQTFLVL